MVEGAELLLMLQGPGQYEERGERITGYVGKTPTVEPARQQPLLGPTGFMVNQQLLPLTGLTRDQVSIGNVLRCRYTHKDTLPGPVMTRAAVEHCQTAYFRPPASTKVVMALGNPSKWALTGLGTVLTGVEAWRGWMAPYRPPWLFGTVVDADIYTPTVGPTWPDVPVLVTLHPADVFHAARMKLPLKADFTKAARFLRGQWPRPMLPIHTMGEPDMWQDGSAFDTEYDHLVMPPKLLRYSLCTPQEKVYVIEAAFHDPTLVPTTPLHLIGQNFCTSFDLPLARQLGVTVGRVDDTMVLDAVLYPGWPHDLDYLASLHARTNRWKHLSRLNPLLYSGADALGTWDVWRAKKQALRANPAATRTYETYTRPLIAIIQKARARGLQVDSVMAVALAARLDGELKTLELAAHLEVGWPLMLSSSEQVAFQLYTQEHLKVPRGKRRG
jgi:uracil-DNA glycosylase